MILTGVGFWLIAGLSAFVLDDLVVWVYLYGIGLIFPVGLLVGKLMKTDLLSTTNPLAKLAGIVGGMQILFAPLVILVLMTMPDWIPMAVGVLTGAHFLPFAVIYRSKGYLFQSIGTVLAASIIGWIFLENTFVITPFVVAAVYIVTCILLHFEHHAEAGKTEQ